MKDNKRSSFSVMSSWPQCPTANANRVLLVRIEQTVEETLHNVNFSKVMTVFF
jgi:hypothetical protein